MDRSGTLLIGVPVHVIHGGLVGIALGFRRSGQEQLAACILVDVAVFGKVNDQALLAVAVVAVDDGLRPAIGRTGGHIILGGIIGQDRIPLMDELGVCPNRVVFRVHYDGARLDARGPAPVVVHSALGIQFSVTARNSAVKVDQDSPPIGVFTLRVGLIPVDILVFGRHVIQVLNHLPEGEILRLQRIDIVVDLPCHAQAVLEAVGVEPAALPGAVNLAHGHDLAVALSDVPGHTLTVGAV